MNLYNIKDGAWTTKVLDYHGPESKFLIKKDLIKDIISRDSAESHTVPRCPAQAHFLIQRFKFSQSVLFLIFPDYGQDILPQRAINDPGRASQLAGFNGSFFN
jgi:hypothetical protein